MEKVGENFSKYEKKYLKDKESGFKYGKYFLSTNAS